MKYEYLVTDYAIEEGDPFTQLDTFGAEGWELVAVLKLRGPVRSYQRLFFKRALREGGP